MSTNVVIIGAGLMGLTTAYWLNAAGASVHVVDSAPGPGLGVSFANGGMLTPSQANPWNAPGIANYALRSIGAEDSPFLIRWAAFPRLLRWGIDFLMNSRQSSYRRNARRNFALGSYSLARHREILAATEIECGQARSGTLQVFRDLPALENAFAIADFLSRDGLVYQRLDRAGLLAREPALALGRSEHVGGLFFPEDDSGDAYRFCVGMADYLVRAGVIFSYRTSVNSLEMRGRRIRAARSDNGPIAADVFVIAAASRSSTLLHQLGIKSAIYPVKGYSATIRGFGDVTDLRIPLVDMHRKVAITPLGDALRIAGTAEFTGMDESIDAARVAMLLRDAAEIVPGLEGLAPDRITSWAGLRPVTPTGFPLLGRRGRNLFLNAGHGPLGWTFAAGSGRIISDLVMHGRHELAGHELASLAISAP
ncbi:FAD-dependent oxidoreductase [Sphingosinicella sp. LHD-64]|uniref:FAD-dependent oxidoreductase n=1 Tax=Sphingosinicella sp. LHD-64 TaxID=3072139 RepID=UPI00280E5806|nr:FAD-dependent oxidoreductase [Sphingosinicella sp. LHD-64]MDQ8757442.1 FAD-dependent oxidoreductase [Sphingosinicella sp. LHD-64]